MSFSVRRVQVLFRFVSACARIREWTSVLNLLAEHARFLFRFDRLSINLCDDGRQIVRSTVIHQKLLANDVAASQMNPSDMAAILETLATGHERCDARTICVPMVSSGRVVGVLCLASDNEHYTDHDLKLAHFVGEYLAGTFERILQDSLGTVPFDFPVSGRNNRGESKTTAPDILREMFHLAQYDALTDLPNRWLINERLARALAMARRYQRRLAVLFLDVDRFKEINDTYGHAIGDQLLRQVSSRLVACVRMSDTVSRIGGDEFLILLTEIDGERDAVFCSEKIVESFAAPFNVAGHEFNIRLSIGIGNYPGDGENAETLIDSADSAMYRAKRAGTDKRFASGY
jgi:diguanylate cyclase (GGDEF)-like protein